MTSYKMIISAILGAIAVALGAFGAHGLKPLLDTTQLETFKTASLYHFIHLVAMMVLALIPQHNDKVISLSFRLFFVGIILFSGSLYALSTKSLIGGDMWNFLGPLTPIGGLAFIAAWLNLIRYKSNNQSLH
ncbi:MAG: DUF423 domain-containing protein [Saprospiraceae bacterium]|nr:DUF423 domain-containing protein [Saprospiraceae bacterium]